MSEPKFAPGPWHVTNDWQKRIRDKNNRAVADLVFKNKGDFKDNYNRGNANAHLIATAPSFYEDEEKKLVYLRMLKKELSQLIEEMPFFKYRMRLRTVVHSLDIIANQTEELLAKARGEKTKGEKNK